MRVFREGFFIRPRFAADDAKARLQRFAVNAHALYRAGRGALPAADLRAFKRGPGRAGGRDHLARIAEHQLGIGADIHHQRDFLARMRRLGKRRRRGVGADMPGDARQKVGARAGVNAQLQIIRARGHRRVGGQRKRRAAQFHRIDAEQQVMHDRIADQHQVQNIFGRDFRLARDFFN